MTFEEYLKSKKIDPKTFAKRDAARFLEFETLFSEVSPNSFTQQKLFLINRLRRQFPYSDQEEQVTIKKTTQVKPKIAPRIIK